jgi:hypothetical protein
MAPQRWLVNMCLLRFMDPAEQAVLLIHEQEHGIFGTDRLAAGLPGSIRHRVAFASSVRSSPYESH